MRRRQAGFALLIVLWTMVFLAFLFTQIMASGRVAVGLAANLRDAAQARAAADGGIETAVFHLLLSPGADHWGTDGRQHEVDVGTFRVMVRIRTLTGLVNPNLASAALLEGVLQSIAVPASRATDLAGAIVAWRSPPDSSVAGEAAFNAYRHAGYPYGPPAHPFATAGELIYVLGMTPDVLSRLTPHLSVLQPGDPDPAAADPVVLKAIALANNTDPDGGGYEGAPVVAITACALPPAPLCRRGVVSLSGANAVAPFTLLVLETGH